MSKLIITLSVILCALRFDAQTALYLKLKKAAELAYPEIRTENKLIAFNVWEVEDAESRAANKSFEKAYNVYQAARLKGGLKGLVVICVSKDNLSSTATITLTKDGIVKSIPLKLEDIQDEPSLGATKNMVFDSSGNVVYKDLPAEAVFPMIQQLITR